MLAEKERVGYFNCSRKAAPSQCERTCLPSSFHQDQTGNRKRLIGMTFREGKKEQCPGGVLTLDLVSSKCPSLPWVFDTMATL